MKAGIRWRWIFNIEHDVTFDDVLVLVLDPVGDVQAAARMIDGLPLETWLAAVTADAARLQVWLTLAVNGSDAEKPESLVEALRRGVDEPAESAEPLSVDAVGGAGGGETVVEPVPLEDDESGRVEPVPVASEETLRMWALSSPRQMCLMLHEQGATYAQLAELCGVAPSTVGRWVRAEKRNK